MITILDHNNMVIERRTWVYNRRNVNRIAYEYDATVERFDKTDAKLKDSFGRLLWVDSFTPLQRNKALWNK